MLRHNRPAAANSGRCNTLLLCYFYYLILYVSVCVLFIISARWRDYCYQRAKTYMYE